MNPFSRIYSPLYRHLVFPAVESVRGRRTHLYLKELREMPYLPREKLEEIRRDKLLKVVRYAYENVPFYKKLFDDRGLEVERVTGIEDLRKAGIIIDKELVRKAGDAILSPEYKKERLHSSGTGGSMGQPVVFYMTMDDWMMRMAIKYRGEEWVGKPLGTPTSIIWGHGPSDSIFKWMKYLLYWRIQNYQFLSAFDLSDEKILGYIRAIKMYGSEFLESYVTVAYEMAKVIDRYRVTPPQLRGILVGAEKLYDFQQELIEEVFGCPVYNRYGCTEFSNVASECKERRGMHINIDRVWVEVLDAGGEPVEDEVGDLVITDLDNFAMPLIRYRIGDRGILSTESCSCGINFPLLKDVVGRESQMLVTPQGRKMHDIYFIWLISRSPGLKRFKIVQKAPDLLDFFLVADGIHSKEDITAFIEDKLSELAGMGIKFRYHFVDEIPLTTSGKMLYFVSEVKQANE